MKTTAEHKQRVVNPRGYTMDIVQAVLDCYDKNRQTVPSELLNLCNGYDEDKDLCQFVFNWVDANIDYKVDPSGEQWIKTPARLISDGVGDCKSFTILICSVLTAFGIENKFRFVAYKGKDFQHVYPVAVIDGEEYPMDVVAYKQKGVPIGTELKYKKKFDSMNSTKISELSGVDGMSVQISNTMSVAELVAESMSLVAMAQLRKGMYWKYQLLSKVIHDYQNNLDNLKLACYMWLYEGGPNFSDYPQKGIVSWDVRVGNIMSCVKGQNNPRSGYAIDEDVFDSEGFQRQWRWLEQNIFPYADKYKEDCENVLVANDLLKVGLNGLYMFIDNRYLNATQKQKKQNQNTFLEILVQDSAFTELSAKNFVYAGFLSMYKITPQDCFNRMFGKDVQSSYSAYLAGGDDDDYCGQIEYNPNSNAYEVVTKAEVVNDNITLSSQIGDWMDKATGWFTKIWNTVTGGTGNDSYKKVTPFYTDSGGGFGWAVLAGAVVIAIVMFKKKRR